MSFAVDKNEIQEIKDSMDRYSEDPKFYAEVIIYCLDIALTYIDQLEKRLGS